MNNDIDFLLNYILSARPKKVTESKMDSKSQREKKKAEDSYDGIVEEYQKQLEKRNKQNRAMKWAFFIISFACLIATIVLCYIIIINLIHKDGFAIETLVAILGSLGTFLTSMLLLPKIIGKYLYPPNEDDKMLQFIISMRDIKRSEHDVDEQMKLKNELNNTMNMSEIIIPQTQSKQYKSR